MPRISEFHGIAIYMYYSDHRPPHFYAIYGEHEAVVAIAATLVLRGNLPSRQMRLVQAWVGQHRHELLQDWKLAQVGRPLRPIEPLE